MLRQPQLPQLQFPWYVHHIMQGLIVGVPVDAPLYPTCIELTCFGQQLEATPQTDEKRGRGRPRKNPESATPKPAASDGPKRGRGRPRKTATVTESDVVTPASAKRGRGRPRKEPGMEVLVIYLSGARVLTIGFVCRNSLCYTRNPSDQEKRRPRKTSQEPSAEWTSRIRVEDTSEGCSCS